MPTVRQALKIIQQLSASDINRLYQALAQQVKSSVNPSDPLIKSIRERKNEDGFLCPYCHSKHVIRFGTYNVQGVRRQRYRCCQCYMTRFNGVATKYLDHYLAWFRFLDQVGFENTAHNIKKMMITACSS